MNQYEVGQARFYPSLGRWAYPGEIITLDEAEANNLMQNEPGLLKPAKQTTQAVPSVARQAPKNTQAQVVSLTML